MNLLVDDRQLARVLRREVPIARETNLCTTGLWYMRLCQAVLRRESRGVLSRPFAVLPEAQRSVAIDALITLPDEIELLSLRLLGPRIARLREQHQLNLLGIEALAASIELDATVVLSVTSPKLEEALAREGVAYEFA